MKELYLLTDNGFIGYDPEGSVIQTTDIIGVFSSKSRAIRALRKYNNHSKNNSLNTFSITKYSMDIENGYM